MSQIIPIGIGTPAQIPQLVLTGLSPVPDIPVGGHPGSILQGQTVKSFDSFTSTVDTDGTEFTLPARAVQITWEVIYGSAPGTADMRLQASLDGNAWITIDTSVLTAGDLKTVKTSARFIRAFMGNMSAGITTTVLISVQPTESWF